MNVLFRMALRNVGDRDLIQEPVERCSRRDPKRVSSARVFLILPTATPVGMERTLWQANLPVKRIRYLPKRAAGSLV